MGVASSLARPQRSSLRAARATRVSRRERVDATNPRSRSTASVSARKSATNCVASAQSPNSRVPAVTAALRAVLRAVVKVVLKVVLKVVVKVVVKVVQRHRATNRRWPRVLR